MVVLVAKYALDSVKKGTNAALNLRAMGKSGIELRKLYFDAVKAGYPLKNPSVYMLRVEFDIYFCRNKVYGNDLYDSVVAETNSRPMLREIFTIGADDKTIKDLTNIDLEVRLLCNAYLNFICALAIKSVSQMETENIEKQLDLFFGRLLEQYRS